MSTFSIIIERAEDGGSPASTPSRAGSARGPGSNPVTHVMDACRALLNGTSVGDTITTTLIWCAVLFLAFCPSPSAPSRQQ